MFTNATSSFGDHLLQRPARLEWDHFLACTTQYFVIPIGTDGIKVTSHILEARHHDPAHGRRSMHSSKQEMHSFDRTERLNRGTIRLRAGTDTERAKCTRVQHGTLITACIASLFNVSTSSIMTVQNRYL